MINHLVNENVNKIEVYKIHDLGVLSINRECAVIQSNLFSFVEYSV